MDPSHAEDEHTPGDEYEMLAARTAEGDGSLLVFLTGREFAGKVLENMPSPDSYEVCALVRDAIESCISIMDNAGTLPCQNFYTLARLETLLQANIQLEAAKVLSAAIGTPAPEYLRQLNAPVSFRIPAQEQAKSVSQLITLTADEEVGIYDVVGTRGLANTVFTKSGSVVTPPLVLVPSDTLIVTSDVQPGIEGVLTLVKR
jgi:hypothetical protein